MQGRPNPAEQTGTLFHILLIVHPPSTHTQHQPQPQPSTTTKITSYNHTPSYTSLNPALSSCYSLANKVVNPYCLVHHTAYLCDAFMYIDTDCFRGLFLLKSELKGLHDFKIICYIT